jgi:hypothetical protein
MMRRQLPLQRLVPVHVGNWLPLHPPLRMINIQAWVSRLASILLGSDSQSSIAICPRMP